MKKVVFGALVFLAGAAVNHCCFLAGSMSNDWTLNGEQSAWWEFESVWTCPFFLSALPSAWPG